MKRYQQNRLLMLDRTTRWRYCLNYVVDYTCDIFYVCGIELSVTLHPKHNFEQVREVNKRITRLAIGLTNKYRWSAEDLDLGICDRLKALKEIIFVADEERLLTSNAYTNRRLAKITLHVADTVEKSSNFITRGSVSPILTACCD